MFSKMSPFWTALRVPLAICALCVPSAAFEVDLRVTSADADLAARAQSASVVVAAQADGVTVPADILAAARADYGRLVGALYDEGYFGPTVSIRVDGREASGIPALARLGAVAQVDIRIDPGPAFTFGQAQITPLPSSAVVSDAFQIGVPAKTSAIRDAAQAGIAAWRGIGHAKADVTDQQITADHAQARLAVRLGITPGPRLRFGALGVSGSAAVREDRIRQITGLPLGATFDPLVLARAAARLRRTGAFSAVTFQEADQASADDSLDIALELVDAKPRRFGFGAELQSEEGVSLSGFWLHRNLLGGAERFQANAEVSGIGGVTNGLDYQLSFGFTRPATFNADMDLYLEGTLDKLAEPHFTSQQGAFEIGLTRYASDQLTVEAGLGYRYSDVTDDLGIRQFSHFTAPVALTWDGRSDPLNPTHGNYLRTELLPFASFTGSASGARGYVDARAYRSVGAQDRLTFAARVQLGTVIGADLADTPPDLLFLSGGSGTVRGHTYQSLTITNGGTETGGRSFIGLSGEARGRLTDTLSAVGFYDAGYIGANSWADATGGWHSGAGLGVRYDTGIGPIRFDVATPTSGANSGGVQIYIGIGQAF